jgi:hypothetical protein
MKRCKLVVFTSPREGQEDHYNKWYTEQHLPDVVAVPGFVSAQRFKLTDGMGSPHRHQYLAIYEIVSDDPQAVIAEMMGRRDTPAMVISHALDLDGATFGLFEPCSPVVTAAASTPKTGDRSQML